MGLKSRDPRGELEELQRSDLAEADDPLSVLTRRWRQRGANIEADHGSRRLYTTSTELHTAGGFLESFKTEPRLAQLRCRLDSFDKAV